MQVIGKNIAWAVVGVLSVGSARAQTSAGPGSGSGSGSGATGAPPACELHVWPAPGMNSVTMGWFKNDVVDKRLQSAPDQVPLAPEVLSPAMQARYLATLPLADALDLAGATVTIYPAPLDRHAARMETGRHSASAADCYNEMIVMSVHYATAPMFGPSLKTMVYLRAFEGKSDTPRAFLNTTDAPLTGYSPRNATSSAAANADLVTAYKRAVSEFVANAIAWRQKAGAGRH